MPEATIDATIAHTGAITDTLTSTEDSAAQVFEDLASVGIDAADVWKVLEEEGVEKFVTSWNELLDTLDKKLAG